MASLSARLRNTRILIVEGNHFQRALISEALRAVGATSVQMVGDAQEAQKLPNASEIDVLLLDWLAPPLDGLTFTKLLRCAQTGFRADVAIVLVTSHSSAGDVLAAQSAGVDEYLIKPFSTAGLSDRLSAVLFNRRPFVNTATYVGPSRRRKLNARGPRRRTGEAPTQQRRLIASTLAERAQAAAAIRSVLDMCHTSTSGSFSGETLTRATTRLEADIAKLDDLLVRAALRSLITYLQGVGDLAPTDLRVVEAHLEAMRSLVHLNAEDEHLRYKVVRALDLLVLRKLKGHADALHTHREKQPTSAPRTWAL